MKKVAIAICLLEAVSLNASMKQNVTDEHKSERKTEIVKVQPIHNVQPIYVDDEYNLFNGMSGMMRDVILGLLDIMQRSPKNIRIVLGMSNEYFSWRTRSYFLNVRTRYTSNIINKAKDPLFDAEAEKSLIDTYRGMIEVVKLYENKAKNPNFESESKKVIDDATYKMGECLHMAIEKGNVKCVQLLLNEKADVNAMIYLPLGHVATPLYTAVSYENLGLAELLLNNGAEVNAGDDDETPLHLAAHIGNVKLVQLLLARGADVAAKTRYGITPLDSATFYGHVDVANLLSRP
ncbi:hypothetical protein FACS1894126_1150 [Alphaproteobacteria bacterium]|nr:hypothetical protein FACS1894126_1150 [Alphaproteobacteria bacterium]